MKASWRGEIMKKIKELLGKFGEFLTILSIRFGG